ncbi:MAG: hypothetical protein ACPGOV_15680 [Magnetovibrionaceae bacterium]
MSGNNNREWTRAFWLEQLTPDGWQRMALHGSRDLASRHMAQVWAEDEGLSLRVMREIRLESGCPFFKEVVRLDSKGRAAKGGARFRPQLDSAEHWRTDDNASEIQAFLAPTS